MEDPKEYLAELEKAQATYFQGIGRGPKGEFPPPALAWFGETAERVCAELHAMKGNASALGSTWDEQGQEDFYWGDMCEQYEASLERMEASLREMHKGMLAGWFQHRERLANGKAGDTHGMNR